MLMLSQTIPGSGVPRRLLGQCLRDLRLESGLTVKRTAGALEWSEQKLWRIETGQTAVRGLDVEAMCALYGASPDLAKALVALARQPKTDGWWHAYGEATPGGFDVYARLEEQASAILGYAPAQVPELLRTEDYARALITISHPGTGTDEIDRLAHEVLGRRLRVTRAAAPLAVTLFLSETLVRCPVGGAAVMAGQLRYLAELAALPNVRLQVVPFSAGLHAGLRTGQFTLLRFPSRDGGGETRSATVYLPRLTGELYLDSPHDVLRYDEAHTDISAHAMDEPSTRDLLLSAAKEFGQ
jgi:transcriptional regulator with XRE-family HTH domain